MDSTADELMSPREGIITGVMNLNNMTIKAAPRFSLPPAKILIDLGILSALSFLFVILVIDIYPAIADDTTSPANALRIGYPGNLDVDVDKRDAMAAMEIWVMTMTKKLNRSYKPQYIIFNSPHDLILLVKAKRTDMIGMSGLDFIRVRDLRLLEPALVSPIGGKATEQFVLLSRKDRGYKSLNRLINKMLLVEAGGKKESGLLWLDTLLMRKGLPASSSFFSSIKEVNKASQAVHPVFFDQSDACLVAARSYSMMCELNPQIGEDLIVMERSPELLRHVMCFRTDCNPLIKRDLKDILPRIHEFVEGRQMLTLLKTERIVPYDPVSIRPLEELLEEYKRLRQKEHDNRKTK
jgi:hypothetical protein